MKYLAVLFTLLLLCGCSAPPEETVPDPVSAETQAVQLHTAPTETTDPEPVDPILVLLESMSLEDRVGQLFLARCNASTAATDIEKYHLGGLVLFGVDFENQNPESMTNIITSYQNASRIPLLIAVDEEGGTVNRVSRYSQFRSSPYPSIRTLYSQGGVPLILEMENDKCRLLSSLGINVNLGPVCDITTQPGAILYQRSLGLDADVTGNVIAGIVETMSDYPIGSVLKHFPGYGNNADTHVQITRDKRSLETLEGCDLIPFQRGIDAGADAIMVSHNIVEGFDGENPASLSPVVHRYLREEMGFEGVIITDDLVMGAIKEQYGAGEAAVLAVLAGNDILCSTEYAVQYEAVLAAVLTGRIDYYTLTDAVIRILKWKQELGLIAY